VIRLRNLKLRQTQILTKFSQWALLNVCRCYWILILKAIWESLSKHQGVLIPSQLKMKTVYPWIHQWRFLMTKSNQPNSFSQYSSWSRPFKWKLWTTKHRSKLLRSSKTDPFLKMEKVSTYLKVSRNSLQNALFFNFIWSGILLCIFKSK
jgi:hypothetical protein